MVRRLRLIAVAVILAAVFVLGGGLLSVTSVAGIDIKGTGFDKQVYQAGQTGNLSIQVSYRAFTDWKVECWFWIVEDNGTQIMLPGGNPTFSQPYCWTPLLGGWVNFPWQFYANSTFTAPASTGCGFETNITAAFYAELKDNSNNIPSEFEVTYDRYPPFIRMFESFATVEGPKCVEPMPTPTPIPPPPAITQNTGNLASYSGAPTTGIPFTTIAIVVGVVAVGVFLAWRRGYIRL